MKILILSDKVAEIVEGLIDDQIESTQNYLEEFLDEESNLDQEQIKHRRDADHLGEQYCKMIELRQVSFLSIDEEDSEILRSICNNRA